MVSEFSYQIQLAVLSCCVVLLHALVKRLFGS